MPESGWLMVTEEVRWGTALLFEFELEGFGLVLDPWFSCVWVRSLCHQADSLCLHGVNATGTTRPL